jgi:cytochrome c heme-lyase
LQFWNALVRKDKTEGVSEQDMDTVIAIHNNMNEGTWNQVLEWEKLVNDPAKAAPGRESKLLKFCGRPDEYSPKARLKMLFGHPAPFDRHDWTIDRGGNEVRYIIDYYHDESAVQKDKTPKHMADPAAMQSIKVDVRPALDSPASILARLVLMPWRRLQGNTLYNPPPFFAPKVMIQAEQGKLQRIGNDWKQIAEKCVAKKEALQKCASEEECRAASVALQACTASVVCPSVAAAFLECTTVPAPAAGAAKKEVDMKQAAATYSAMVQCLELFEIDSLKAMGKDSASIEASKGKK